LKRGISEEALWSYFSINGLFDEVYVASWQEDADRTYGKLKIVDLILDKGNTQRFQEIFQRSGSLEIEPGIYEFVISNFRSINADIIIVYDNSLSAALGVELKKWLGVPMAVLVPNNSQPGDSHFNFADAIICSSESMGDSLEEADESNQKVYFIPGYTEMKVFDNNMEHIFENMSYICRSLIPEKKSYSNKVSIVLPTYNGADYIRRSVNSCLAQTHSNIELVIVNDCSTDKTPDIIRSYKDPRIKYIEHEVNKKLPGALNTGFANATGEYLTWTSDDNYYAPESIEHLLGFLNLYPDVDFVYTDYYSIDEDGEIMDLVELSPANMLIYGNCVGACFLYKRDVYEKTGDFNPDAFLAEDYEYWLRIANNFRMQRLRRPVYYYQYHSKSLTSEHGEHQIHKRTNEVRRDLLLKEFNLSRKIRSKIYISIAFDEYHYFGNLSQVRHNIIPGILYDPSSIARRSIASLTLKSLLGKRITKWIDSKKES